MNETYPFRTRQHAGQSLAERLSSYSGRSDVLILALPRGGVAVGSEVAHALGVPMDVCIVRKLGAPGCPELAMGAIATGGAYVLNPDVLQDLHLDDAEIRAVAEAEKVELRRRESAYREGREPLDITGKTVILVDDGLATGATMVAAVAAIKQRGAARLIVAVPVAPPEAVARVGELVDEVICLLTPPYFRSIGVWYDEFPQLDDDDVRRLLHEAQLHTTSVD